jgi:hypothetical protein
VVGDTIHRWGDDLPVTRIFSAGNGICLYYMDTDGEEKSIDNRASAEYIAKKRIEGTAEQGRVIGECEAVVESEQKGE